MVAAIAVVAAVAIIAVIAVVAEIAVVAVVAIIAVIAVIAMDIQKIQHYIAPIVSALEMIRLHFIMERQKKECHFKWYAAASAVI